MRTLLEQIATATGAELGYDVALSRYTTTRLGGTARAMFTCRSIESLVACVQQVDAAGLKVLLLAGGSNLVIADGELDLIVVRIAAAKIRIERAGDHALVHAEAGADWDELVAQTVQAGLGGLECLSGIPGSVGATPVQNVGAYGVEVGSLLRRVQLLDRCSGDIYWVKPAELQLGYRYSRLKYSDQTLVLAAEFCLTTDGLSAPLHYQELNNYLDAQPGERRAVASVRKAVLALRAAKGMVLDIDDYDTWSAGALFTNPIDDHRTLQHVRGVGARLTGDASLMPAFPDAKGTKLSAAWLIERAGFGKGYPGPQAPIRLSTRHSLALTNRGRGTTSELLALAREIRSGVEDVFSVRLEPEPVLIGCEI